MGFDKRLESVPLHSPFGASLSDPTPLTSHPFRISYTHLIFKFIFFYSTIKLNTFLNYFRFIPLLLLVTLN